jgi:outer membrane murein-binding lipoprotein Lpp
MTTSTPRRTPRLLVAAVVLVSGLLAACGSDDDDATGATDTTTASGYVEIPIEEVLAGLPAIVAAGEAADEAAQAGDFDAVLAEYEELHEVWEEVEGTIKATDRDHYEAIETAQSLIKDGGENEDADRVATGVADQAAAIDSFIAGNS